MASTAEETTIDQEDPPDLNVGELVKGRLEKSLPRVLWIPLFYGVYMPLAVVTGFSWIVFWAGMPWTGFGGIITVVGFVFGVQAAYKAIGLLVVLIVVATGVYGNLEPAQVNRVRDFGARGRTYAKWYLYNSIF
ncbi:hypothetical protein [Halobacterium wangiae]|uniref:hypothetical protein n=1 Tax=Halobacterium wangiae TaxID=2902623 RepID=UPI001E599C57|nr:hypothetical protein [Halobacterium wangiae]